MTGQDLTVRFFVTICTNLTVRENEITFDDGKHGLLTPLSFHTHVVLVRTIYKGLGNPAPVPLKVQG